MSDEWDEPAPVQPPPPQTQPSDDDEPTCAVAVLWVPDPEQRHGWREFYIRRERKPGQKRPMGYRGAK